jgi:hypothetical protein
MFKYFNANDMETIDAVKKQYKKLAFTYHPDVAGSGSTEKMAEVNNEYEQALKICGTKNHKTYNLDPEYMDIISKMVSMHMVDVNIEICGWFVYVSGSNTRAYASQLKENGLKWNSSKVAWYYAPSWWTKKGNTWSMDKIRQTYGSQNVDPESRQTVAG